MGVFRMRFSRLLVCAGAFASATVFVCATAAQAAVPTPQVNYAFNGTLTDGGGGSSLTVTPACPDPVPNTPDNQCVASSGFGSDASGPYWTWTAGNPTRRGGGFTIQTNSPLTSTYSMEVKFSFDTIPSGGYVKIIDYQDRTSDDGFYFYNQKIDFFASGAHDGTDTYAAGAVLDLIITRDNTTNLFTVYSRTAGGPIEQVFQYNDDGALAVPHNAGSGSLVGFFFDDNVTLSEATTGGKAYVVKMWEGTALTQAQVEEESNGGASGDSSQSPPPWLQQYGRASAAAVCATGWNPSWANWAVPYTGGWVCNRGIYMNNGQWYVSPDGGWISGGAVGSPWTGS